MADGMSVMFPLMRHPNKRATYSVSAVSKWSSGDRKFPLMRHPNKRATIEEIQSKMEALVVAVSINASSQ
jgi:hypothetical protein